MSTYPKFISVFSIAIICFFAGGGWHFLCPSDQFIYGLFYRVDGNSAERWAWAMLFLFCGPAAAMAGAIIAAIISFSGTGCKNDNVVQN